VSGPPYSRTRRIKRRAKSLMLRRMPFMLTCAEVEAFLLAYHEGELSPLQRATFDFHLRLCPPCRTSLAHYEKAIALGRKLFTEEDEATVDERFVTAVLAARKAR
jgi:anti-sigma factor RsiW